MIVPECPEDQNSTDCLLRAILIAFEEIRSDEEDSFDWDPLSFGFTLPISLLAAAFAFGTIFQAMAAAGQGRKRSNRGAIGKWAQGTKRSWNWGELVFQSTAKTPLLSSNNVSQALLSNIKDDDSVYLSEDEKSSVPESLEKWAICEIWAKLLSWVKGSSEAEDFAATWLGFLIRLGIENPNTLDGVPLKKVAADYLPGDILAAPAYAEVGFIVSSAIAAGAKVRWITSQTYPVIDGAGFRFDFRNHLTLGTIGVFSQYEAYDFSRSSTSQHRLVKTLHHGQGKFELQNFRDPCYSLKETTPMQDSFNGVEPCAFAALDCPTLDFNQLMSLHARRHEGCENPRTLCHAPDMLSRFSNYREIWTLLASTPKERPEIFPWKDLGVANAFELLSLNADYWATWNWGVDLTGKRKVKTPITNILSRDHFWAATITVSDEPDTWSMPADVREADRPGLPISTEVLQKCLVFRSDPEAYARRISLWDESEKERLSSLVGSQLRRIDKWLEVANIATLRVHCRVRTISHRTLGVSAIKEAINNFVLKPMLWLHEEIDRQNGEDIAREVELFRVLSCLDTFFPFLDPDHEDDETVAKITGINFDKKADQNLRSLGNRGRKCERQQMARRKELSQQWEVERREIVRQATKVVRVEAQRLKKEAFGYLVGLESLDNGDHVSEVKVMLKSLEEVHQRFEKRMGNMRDRRAARK
jgi:hypothetical protein